MKANQDAPAPAGADKDKSVETTVREVEEADLNVEKLEDVIAPKIVLNHNETMVRDTAPTR